MIYALLSITIDRSRVRKASIETRYEMMLTMYRQPMYRCIAEQTWNGVGLKTGTERMVLKGCGRSIEARIEYAYQTIAWIFDT